jgi:SAM-dependent methyltransferase
MNDSEYKSMFEVEDTHWWYVSLHELISSYVQGERERVGTPLEMLEAGCGTGRLCQIIGKYGNVKGVDASELAVGFCRKRGLENVSLADLNSAELGANLYDVITSIDVIYHRDIKDEKVVLERFFAALKPGGVLILNVPAFEFLRSTHDIAVQTRRRYTRKDLDSLLSICGFSVEKSSYRIACLFPPIAIYRLARRILPHSPHPENVVSDVYPPSPLLNKLLLSVARAENSLQRLIPLTFGTSAFMIARRP